jgi:leucyl-tRNA synthetase
MADVKTISGCLQELMLNILLPKSQFRLDWGLCLGGYGTGAVMAVPCGDERDYAFANFFKGQSGMPEIKIFFSNVDIQRSLVLKTM